MEARRERLLRMKWAHVRISAITNIMVYQISRLVHHERQDFPGPGTLPIADMTVEYFDVFREPVYSREDGRFLWWCIRCEDIELDRVSKDGAIITQPASCGLLAIARAFGVDYGDVMTYAEWLRRVRVFGPDEIPYARTKAASRVYLAWAMSMRPAERQGLIRALVSRANERWGTFVRDEWRGSDWCS